MHVHNKNNIGEKMWMNWYKTFLNITSVNKNNIPIIAEEDKNRKSGTSTYCFYFFCKLLQIHQKPLHTAYELKLGLMFLVLMMTIN